MSLRWVRSPVTPKITRVQASGGRERTTAGPALGLTRIEVPSMAPLFTTNASGSTQNPGRSCNRPGGKRLREEAGGRHDQVDRRRVAAPEPAGSGRGLRGPRRLRGGEAAAARGGNPRGPPGA